MFWELSLPLAREAPSFPRSVISSGLEAFFAGEKLEVRPGVVALTPSLNFLQALPPCFTGMHGSGAWF